jgi:hypothetical protein
MNSDEEAHLFSMWGWKRDYVARCWYNPSGKVYIGIDALMQLTRSPEGEGQLIGLVIAYGVRQRPPLEAE